ncbi:hypothetical protein BGZ54_002516 [Gamsiella multidivaricata]|nr:hypothetical protein BGZ54_002516 [Gamsiella multidivaricata]
MRHGSKFRKALPPHVGAVAGKVEPIMTDIHEKWPTLESILNRVFAKNHYEDVSKAIRDENLQDSLVGYIFYVVLSYLNYFTFHDEIPSDLNEREGFIDLTWAFIRGAMTLVRIETRSLEVLITGVQERKNQDKDFFIEAKQVGHYADGVAFRDSSQLYLSEASTIHSPKADKCVRDEFKLARVMRDSWVSQVRSTCREAKQDFGIKAKAAVTRCLELTLRIEEEIEARLANTSVVEYEERIKLEDAASTIESTTASPAKNRTKRRWTEAFALQNRT